MTHNVEILDYRASRESFDPRVKRDSIFAPRYLRLLDELSQTMRYSTLFITLSEILLK